MQRCVIHWLPSSELQDARSLCLKTRPNAKQISIIMQSKLFFTRKFLHVASFWNWGCLKLGDMSLLPRAYIIIWHNLPEISSPIAKLFGSFGSLKSDFQWISTHKLNEVCIIQFIIQETGLHFFYSYSYFFWHWNVPFVAIQTRIPGTISSLNLCLKYLTIIEKLYQANFLKIHLF